jgi:phospholipid-binding lipoprotein MlaA
MTKRMMIKTSWRVAAASLVLALLQGCAVGADPTDPLENFNRGVFSFNDGVDRAVFKPVATVYHDITPSPVRTGVTNFFSNIGDVWSLVNNVLQFKPKESVETLMRISFNTILGFGGVLDIATEMRMQKHPEDFGQTLGYWGMGPGPYIVLPLLGPSDLRDTIGASVDASADLVNHLDRVSTRNSLATLRLVNARANLLGAGDLVDQAALDKYSFTRDAYLQRRVSMIGRDKPPVEERFDLPEGAAPAGGAAPASTQPASK